ncbi:MAG: toxin-antitoxin system YwqK family antitoxin [Leptotrichiaceae bacterium]|nr:toxin-antitoxin system YwqK family antitoxin [Leptotrichiaceae bacterium]
MKKIFSKPLIILFSCFISCFYVFSENFNMSPKKSHEYLYLYTEALNSPYFTVETVSVSDAFAVLKEDGSPFTGTLVEFNSNSEIKSVKNFKNGLYDGKMYFYYNNGNLLKIMEYSQGKQTGEEIEFYSDGISKSIKNYKNGLLNGSSYEFDLIGVLTSVTNYTDNRKNGKELIVSNGVVTLENNYVNGILSGLSTSYYLDGTLRSTGMYVNNLRNGEWIWKYPDGTVKLVENYQNGKISGNITGYFPNGNKERIFQISNGTGSFTQYYDNGKLKAKGSYINYTSAGDWVFYDKDGNIISGNQYY